MESCAAFCFRCFVPDPVGRKRRLTCHLLRNRRQRVKLFKVVCWCPDVHLFCLVVFLTWFYLLDILIFYQSSLAVANFLRPSMKFGLCSCWVQFTKGKPVLTSTGLGFCSGGRKPQFETVHSQYLQTCVSRVSSWFHVAPTFPVWLFGHDLDAAGCLWFRGWPYPSSSWLGDAGGIGKDLSSRNQFQYNFDPIFHVFSHTSWNLLLPVPFVRLGVIS